MHQVLFRLPVLDVPVYGYGLMLVIGFLAATQLAKYLARRSGLNGDVFVNAALVALVSGVIGARLSHILENLEQFTDPDRSLWANLRAMIDLPSGGLTYYGGFLVASPAVLWYARRKKLPPRLTMDIVAPALMVGLAFGRIGCFLNGCCYGQESHLPWAVRFPYYSPAYVEQAQHGRLTVPPQLRPALDPQAGLKNPNRANLDTATRKLMAAQCSNPVHPAQLYSALTAFLLAALLLAYFTLPHAAGRVFALMLMLEGSTRVLLEMLRVEPPVLGPLSISMLIGIALAATGVALWLVFGRLGATRL